MNKNGRSMSTTAYSYNQKIANFTYFKDKRLENFHFENANQLPEKTVKVKISEREYKLQQMKFLQASKSTKHGETTYGSEISCIKTIYSPILSQMLLKKKEFEKMGKSIDKRQNLKQKSNDNCFDISMIQYKMTSYKRNPFKKKYIKLQAKDYESSDDSIDKVANKITRRKSVDKSNESYSNSTLKKKPIFQANSFKEKKKESIPNSTRKMMFIRQKTMDCRKEFSQIHNDSFNGLSTHEENAQTVYTPPEPVMSKPKVHKPTFKPKVNRFNKTAFMNKYSSMLEKVEREKESINIINLVHIYKDILKKKDIEFLKESRKELYTEMLKRDFLQKYQLAKGTDDFFNKQILAKSINYIQDEKKRKDLLNKRDKIITAYDKARKIGIV
jgi:hypothetical protein